MLRSRRNFLPGRKFPVRWHWRVQKHRVNLLLVMLWAKVLGGKREDLMGKSGDLMGKREDLMGESNDLMGKSDDLMGKSNDLTGKSDDLVGKSKGSISSF